MSLYLLFRRGRDKNLRVIFFLLISYFILDLYSSYLYIHRKDNYYWNNLQSLIDGTILYTFFRAVIRNKAVKVFTIVCAVAFILVWGIQFFILRIHNYFDASSAAENATILLLAAFYYYEQAIKINTPFIYRDPYFLVVCAYFIYSAGVFFLFIYLPSLEKEEVQNYYWLNYAFTIIKSVLLSFAMVVKPATHTFPTHFNVTPKKID